MRKLLKICVSSIIIIGIIIGIKYVNNGIVKSKLSFIINKVAMTIVETEEYKNEFIETKYKNYKIIHNKEFTPALSMVFAYLDNMELRSYELLGYTPKEELTIQIDYDEDVFKARNSIGISAEGAVGYYNNEIKTIYMMAEDTYRDVILDMPKIDFLSDGNILGNTTGFREILFHEYSHYALNSFMNENNIPEEDIPIWFNEGIADYLADAQKLFGEEMNFISLNKLNSYEDWINSCNNENNEPYIQSMYAIYTLVNLKGENIIKDIVLNCKENSFNDSFNEVAGLSLDNFEKVLQDDFININKMYSLTSNPQEYVETKIKCLEEYIKVCEDDIRAYETLSRFYEYNRGFDITEEFLKESIEKHPEEPSLWRYLAILYENNNMLDLANECYLKEKELNLKE
ncbi:MAG: tetratricopeptide repeat protein [Clostridium saudiense]|uniref:tetratricopeptide repeat protein n=1 Tax=Clostridium saudiense TaxID=1414720 RepID=UPI0018AB1C50|nr:hypothetical protein [Clostridium saudiense]MDU3521589.1 hypothetical protein [Clostridium saudiense]